MRSIYTIRFDREVIIPDHWEIPFMSGKCRVLEENGRAKALEITFTGEPVHYAPHVAELSEGPAKLAITGRDDRLMFVKRHVEQAAAFLECLYNVDLATDLIEATYEGETPEEEAEITVKGMKIGANEHPLPLTFDMLTRAFMAAETSDGPSFQATLAKTARNALFSKAYIDSFRYSFLLIEAVFEEGQFKSAGLKTALKSNAAFVAMVRAALADSMPPKQAGNSDTEALLARKSSVEEMIDHLVEKRGFYFHSNVKRKDAWKPDQQGHAEALALVAVGIAQQIAQEAATPIFDDAFAKRHFQDAMNAGASIVFEVRFRFREPEEEFSRDGMLRIKTPGTKVAGRQANAIAQQFLQQFDHDAPVAALERASCVVQGSGQKVFDIVFHLEEPKS